MPKRKLGTVEAEKKKQIISVFENYVDVDTNKVAIGIIENAAFQYSVLYQLQELIRENGLIDTYQNGKAQSGTKDSAYLRAYNNTLKSYNATMKILLGMLPKDKRSDLDDGFDKF